MRVTLALVASLVLAGCVGEAPAAREDAPSAPLPGTPVELTEPTFLAPVSLGWNGRAAEPSIAVAPDGTVYVAAAPQFWRGEDGTFTALGEPVCVLFDAPVCDGFTIVDSPLDGLTGGDASVRVDGNGTVYFAGLNGETGAIPFQRSDDRAETWSEPFDVADGNVSDRQWMVVLPDGRVSVTWRDMPGSEGTLRYRASHDGGITWEPSRVIGPDQLQGQHAVDATSGAVYSPYYEDGLRVARSVDGGLTWSVHVVTEESRDLGLRAGRPLDMFPIAAVDDAGAVYLAWAAEAPGSAPADSRDAALSRVWLSVSLDAGASWSEPRPLSPEGKVAAFPWLVAGAPGRVALTWYEGRAGTPSNTMPDVWDVALVESVDASAPEPTFVGGFANREPTHVGGMCRSGGGCVQRCELGFTFCLGQDRSRSEAFEMALRDGQPVIAWVADRVPAGSGIEIHVGGVERGTPLR